MLQFFAVARQANVTNNTSQSKPKPVVVKKLGKIKRAEVALHNTREDCWMIYEGKVYDITNWIDRHPGGELILSFAGLDATDVFNAFHDEKSLLFLPQFFIGNLEDFEPTPLEKAHRALNEQFKKEKLFESSKLFYTYKICFNFVLLGLAVYSLSQYSHLFLGKLMGLLLLSFFFQQNGWVCHDFLHHQVFKNRRWNNAFGFILGNCFQGFSVAWWKAKHNLHHATTNVKGYDPDIDTMPLLAWSEKVIEGELDGLPQFLIKYQAFFLIPLMCAARISWCIQSVLAAFYKTKGWHKFFEVSCVFLHYVWYFSLIALTLPSSEWVPFYLLNQALGGLLLAAAFSLNHNATPILDAGSQSMEFTKLQVITARDIAPGPLKFFHWFMGGLDLQAEHHLFPKMPRHNLFKVQEAVVPLCKEHNVAFYQTTFMEGMRELFSKLSSVSTRVSKLA